MYLIFYDSSKILGHFSTFSRKKKMLARFGSWTFCGFICLEANIFESLIWLGLARSWIFLARSIPLSKAITQNQKLHNKWVEIFFYNNNWKRSGFIQCVYTYNKLFGHFFFVMVFSLFIAYLHAEVQEQTGNFFYVNLLQLLVRLDQFE